MAINSEKNNTNKNNDSANPGNKFPEHNTKPKAMEKKGINKKPKPVSD